MLDEGWIEEDHLGDMTKELNEEEGVEKGETSECDLRLDEAQRARGGVGEHGKGARCVHNETSEFGRHIGGKLLLVESEAFRKLRFVAEGGRKDWDCEEKGQWSDFEFEREGGRFSTYK